MSKYLIGQRVIVGNEIGTVEMEPLEEGKRRRQRGLEDGVWVKRHSCGFASCYAEHNVKPLPNGQL